MIPTKGCSFLSACRFCLGIKDSVVIAHTVTSCAHTAGRTFAQHDRNDMRLLCTDICEEDLVHGGEAKLRNALRFAAEQFSPSLIFVITGCTTQIMNDDISRVIAEAGGGIPTIAVPIAGFCRGEDGFLASLKAAIEYLPAAHAGTGPTDCVNLIGPLRDDYLAENDLREIRTLLQDIAAVNCIVSCDTAENFFKIPAAARNIVLHGYERAGEALQAAFGTPYTVVDYPYGVEGTSEFLRRISDALQKPCAPITARAEDAVCCRLTGICDHISHLRGVPCAVIGSESHGFALKTMLQSELGMCVKFYDTAAYDDLTDIANDLAESPVAMLFGDSFVRGIARELGVPLFRYCYPVIDQIVCSGKAYAGYSGFLHLLEDMINLALEYDREDV